MKTSPALVVALTGWLLAVVSSGGCTHGVTRMATGTPGTQTAQHFEDTVVKPVSYRYWLYLPQGYPGEPGTKWPLLLFLHGAGERGAQLERVAIHGPPSLVAKGRHFPFIIASPQCPEGQVWSSDALHALLDDLVARYPVDQDRIYCTGLSMGGYGTWDLAIARPERFAAIVPICGGGNFLLAGRLRNLSTWVFHGAKDDVVPLSESERMVRAIERAGGDAKLTVYPDANHNSWTRTYEDETLYQWLLAQRRNIVQH